jgi:DNA polymerase-3 subunit alpha
MHTETADSKANFVHLHVHSHYSLLNALPQIPVLVEEAKKYNMPALALTDNGNLYGAIEFYKTCKAKGIKPIIGVDAYVAVRTRNDKQAGVDNRRHRLILLAKNSTGYRNLLKLVTASYLEGFYYKPRIDKELIRRYAEGLICIFPSFSGETSLFLKASDDDGAKALIEEYKKIFGDTPEENKNSDKKNAESHLGNVFLELTHHPEIEGHTELMEKIKKLASESNTPLVAAHDVYYLHPEDRQARETLISVQNGSDFSERRSDFGSENQEDFSFASPDQMEKNFGPKGLSAPEALTNTIAITNACNVELDLGKWVFPDYKVETGKDGGRANAANPALSYNEELRRQVYEGIARRGLDKFTDSEKDQAAKKTMIDRIEYELGIIFTKGYAPYFLVVGDLLNFAHENGILTTIRGSVAGSIVTYLAGITNVNPIEYKLPFERFLNPERPSAPDIDMDYADNRRDEMIEYAKRKYGVDKVAQIGTFGTMMARGSVRDVTRALGHEYSLGDQIAKLIPMGAQGFPMTIDRAMDEVPELKKLYKSNETVREIIDMAKKIEGCARHISVHAAGVVIAPRPLTDFVPLQYDTKGENKIITQYDMHAVDEAGLLKFDFLGIKNLSILSDAVKNVKDFYGITVDIENIPLDDKKTFTMLAKGETIGLFQLNGSGMTAYLKQLKPTSIHDINAMVALYRPGPMESIPQYIERKHTPMLVQYLDPRMKEILAQSYGVITYQDDVLLISIHLAGYTWLEADKLRKAMGKKIPEVMEAEKSKLIEGFIKHGGKYDMTQEKADAIWKLIEPFAAYGFNKAHAASYGRVAYQTAYMKANFPAVYMASVLTADSGDVEKIGETIAECKRMGIQVLPPSINESFEGFTAVKTEAIKTRPTDETDQTEQNKTQDKIRFGLTTIKNFGEGIARTIIEERKSRGRFKSLGDFLDRIKDKNLNKKSLEALIKSGALDDFEGTMMERGQMLANLEELLAYHKERSAADQNQDSLFGTIINETSKNLSDVRLKPAEPVSTAERLLWEKELLGLYISGHPLDKFREKFAQHETTIKRVREQMREGMTVVIAGIIEEARDLLTKKGDRMMFLKIADFSGSIEAVVFPRTYEECKQILVLEKCIAIRGKISMRNETPSIVAEKIKEL